MKTIIEVNNRPQNVSKEKANEFGTTQRQKENQSFFKMLFKNKKI